MVPYGPHMIIWCMFLSTHDTSRPSSRPFKDPRRSDNHGLVGLSSANKPRERQKPTITVSPTYSMSFYVWRHYSHYSLQAECWNSQASQSGPAAFGQTARDLDR